MFRCERPPDHYCRPKLKHPPVSEKSRRSPVTACGNTICECVAAFSSANRRRDLLAQIVSTIRRHRQHQEKCCCGTQLVKVCDWQCCHEKLRALVDQAAKSHRTDWNIGTERERPDREAWKIKRTPASDIRTPFGPHLHKRLQYPTMHRDSRSKSHPFH